MIPVLEGTERQKRLVLKGLLWITLVSGVGFGVLNGLRELWPLCICELAYAAFSASLLRIVEHTHYLRRWTIIYLTPFFAIMLLAIATPGTTFTMFAWIQTIPIICYLLLGLRSGLAMSLLFVTLGILLYARTHLEGDTLVKVAILGNVLISSLAIMVFSHFYERGRLENERRLMQLASTDVLTGLANRMRLQEIFDRERAHARRNGEPLSLVMLDIDHFKQVNDRYGHQAGDRALQHFSDALSGRLRENDLFCRLGGEEFALLLPGANAQQATALAEELQQRLAEAPLELDRQSTTLTFSAGVASLEQDGQSLDQLLHAADQRTYAAKRAGRNRVFSAATQQVEPLAD